MVASIIGEIGRPVGGEFWEALPDFAIALQGVRAVNEGATEEASDGQLLHRILAHLPVERPSFESLRSLVDVHVAPTADEAAVALTPHLLIADMESTVGSCKSHATKAVLAHGEWPRRLTRETARPDPPDLLQQSKPWQCATCELPGKILEVTNGGRGLRCVAGCRAGCVDGQCIVRCPVEIEGSGVCQAEWQQHQCMSQGVSRGRWRLSVVVGHHIAVCQLLSRLAQ